MARSLLRFIEQLSHVGVTPVLTLQNRQNAILSNRLALLWIGITIPYVLIFAIYDPQVIFFLCIILVSHIATLILNKNKHYTLARVFESINPQIAIYLIGIFWFTNPGEDKFSSFYVLNIAFLATPFLFFSLREYAYIIICVAVSLIAGLTLKITNQVYHFDHSSTLLTTRWFEVFNYITAAGFLSLGFVYIKRSNEYYQKEVSSLLGETTLKNKQLEHQKDAIIEQRDEIQAQRDEIMAQKDRLESKKDRLEKQRDLIYNQNKEITDSINYARHIQKALLPSHMELKGIVKDYFIFNRPYAVVSGDFFWAEKRGAYNYLAVGDCTGHGVPGGFLSMLGMAYLTEIVNKHHAIEADKILNELKQMFIKSLHQTNKDEIHFDGIDLALCAIDQEKRKISFSGAFNSLYIIRNRKLLEIKGDRMPIGFYLGEYESFSEHEIDIQEGDKYFLFTDGYLSQPGGESGSQLNKKRFKQLLLDVAHLPPREQCLKLETYLIKWIGEYDQMDDILIMGFTLE